MESPDKYDDDMQLFSYVMRWHRWYMSEFELNVYDLADLRARARQSVEAAEFLKWYETQYPADVVETSKANSNALLAHYKQRILDEAVAGKIAINRCPICNRIVRTPHAKQCFWCGYDWHDKA